MSIQEAQALQDLIWLLRSLHERVSAIEERQPTWASGNLALADVAARLERLERAAAASNGNAPAIAADPGETWGRHDLARDPPGLPPGGAQPMAQCGALRTAIAGIVEREPHATAPRVIEALRASYAGKLPSVRTARWHLQALRGNGNGNGNAA
jgi:hypothetical protein